MRDQPTISDEILQVRQTLFKDYLNTRDQVKRSARTQILKLTEAQASRILAIARRNYRKREVQKNAKWFQRFTHNVETYYGACKLGNWGSFQDR